MGDREGVTPARSLCSSMGAQSGWSHPRAPHPALPPSITPCVTSCLAETPGMAVGTHRRELGHNFRPWPVRGEVADPQSWAREFSAAPS